MKQTIPFNFKEIYKELEAKFEALGYDSPYEGSNLDQLLTAMSYVTSMLNINTAVNINETLLTLAEKRKNILQDARILGYEASKKISYKYRIRLKFTKIGKFLIPKYSVFKSGTKSFYYFGPDITVDIKDEKTLNTFTQLLDVKEGTLIRHQSVQDLTYNFTGLQNYIDIPYTNVEDDGIEIFATYYDPIRGRVEKEQWVKSSVLILDKRSVLNKEFLRLENLNTNTPRCYFSYSGIGFELPAGTIIEANILQTSGSEGKAGDTFSNDPALVDFCAIDKNYKPLLLVTGLEEETDASIKANAPLMHNTAARVVTALDYKAVANSPPAVEDCIVWGGEDEIPVRLGHIYYSFLPSKNKKSYNLYNKINNQYILEGPNTEQTVSERRYYFLDKPDLTTKNYISNTEILSQTLDENGNILNPGVWDIIDKYKLPALSDNLRNPIYVYVDFYIDVKKYKLGIPQSEIRQKIFDKLSEVMNNLEHFDTVFFKSNIIKKLDQELSDIMGISLKPKFYVMINKDNTAKKRIKSLFSNNIRSYIKLSQNKTSASLKIWLPLSAAEGDTIDVTYSKNIVPLNNGQYSNKDKIQITSTDTTAGIKVKEYDIHSLTNSTELEVKFVSKDETVKLDGTDIQFFNISNKRVYFYPKINAHTSQLYIELPKFALPGDKIKVIAHYGNTPQKETAIVEEYTITKNDRYIKHIEILDRFRGSYAGIIHPLTYEVEFTSSKINTTIKGEYCNSKELVKQKTEKQDTVFGGLNLKQLYYDYFIDESGTNITVYLPTAIAQKGDNIVINSKYNIKNKINIELTNDHLAKGQLDTVLPYENIELLSYSYNSVKGENIGMYPLYYKDKELNTVEEINDDSLNNNSKLVTLKTEWRKQTSLDGKERFVDAEITMFANVDNTYDVRNLVINLKDNSNLFTIIPPGSELAKAGLEFQYPNLRWKFPNKNQKIIPIIFDLNGTQKTFLIKVLPLSQKNIDLNAEGDGGVFMYLDFPFEGIYNNNKLVLENLPKIDTDNFINNKRLYVDTTINGDSAKSIFPYVVPEDQLDKLTHQDLEYINFPIKLGDEIVGTYTIYNDRIPYIRIKFKRFITTDTSQYLNLKYITDNIHFIRNSYLRLRNVYFDTGLAGE